MRISFLSGPRTRCALQILSALLFILTLGVVLVGCGSLGGGAMMGAASYFAAMCLIGLSIAGFLTGCGSSGSASGNINAGNAAAQSASTSTRTTTTTTSPTAATAVKLAFLNAPKAEVRSQALTPITPAIEVAIEDASGNIVTTATNAITISIGSGPKGSKLSGTLTVNAISGIATFSNLIISPAGANITLVATAAGLQSGTSTVFDIQPLALNYPARRDFVAGVNVTAVASGDFNGDGNLDVAVTNYGSNSVSILLGNGDGTFQAPQNVAFSLPPQSIAVGDVNHDGIADLAVTLNNGSNPGIVSVLLGNGDGTFRTSQNTLINLTPRAVLIADIVTGSNPCILATDSSNHVDVLIGNGDGTFRAGINATLNGTPTAMDVGDFNNDGNLDLAVGYGSQVSVLLGHGDGTFGSPTNVATGLINPLSLTTAHFNNDGNLDIAVLQGSDVTILMGNGDGTFRAPTTFNAGATQTDLVAVDLNGDGPTDLIAVGSKNAEASVLIGNGDGTFQTPVNYVLENPASAVVAGTFNGTHVSIVAAIPSFATRIAPLIQFGATKQGGISVLTGNGDGTFVTPPTYATGGSPEFMTLADVNGDGIADMVVPTYENQSISVLLGNGDGTFQAARSYPSNVGGYQLVVADVNGDNHADIAVAGEDGVAVLLGNGDGTFGAAQNVATVSGYFESIAAVDLNGDHKVDLVATNNSSGSLEVLLGNGDGTFQAPQNVATGSANFVIATDNNGNVLDFNGDGIPDLAVTNYSQDNVSILLGHGDGTFQAPINVSTSPAPVWLTAGDVNGDGKTDLVIQTGATNLNVLLGNGNGTFQAARNVPFAPMVGDAQVALGDVNDDGILDIVMANYAYGGRISVLLGNGDGSFQGQQMFGAGLGAGGVAVGDLNGDGKLDFVVTNYMGSSVSVLLHE